MARLIDLERCQAANIFFGSGLGPFLFRQGDEGRRDGRQGDATGMMVAVHERSLVRPGEYEPDDSAAGL